LTRTAKLQNAHPDVVLDGGGLVTLSGAGRRRVLYLNTCDQAQGWTTSHCNDQGHPRLTVQNLTLRSGNATGQTTDGGGGGAIFARGGLLKVVHSRFVANTCDRTGPGDREHRRAARDFNANAWALRTRSYGSHLCAADARHVVPMEVGVATPRVGGLLQ
jgi:hypothetical protein